MTRCYDVLNNGRSLALGYVSSHPFAEHLKVISIIPITRKGKWADNTFEITFDDPAHDIIEKSTPDHEALSKLLASAGIDSSDVAIIERTE